MNRNVDEDTTLRGESNVLKSCGLLQLERSASGGSFRFAKPYLFTAACLRGTSPHHDLHIRTYICFHEAQGTGQVRTFQSISIAIASSYNSCSI